MFVVIYLFTVIDKYIYALGEFLPCYLPPIIIREVSFEFIDSKICVILAHNDYLYFAVLFLFLLFYIINARGRKFFITINMVSYDCNDFIFT